jgi:hypothetical protein
VRIPVLELSGQGTENRRSLARLFSKPLSRFLPVSSVGRVTMSRDPVCEHTFQYDSRIASRDKVPETPTTKINTEKCMISIIWFISGLHSHLALTKRAKYNSQYFREHVIPDIHIQQNILTMRQLTIRDFLQKQLNPQKPKERRINLIAQTRRSIK